MKGEATERKDAKEKTRKRYTRGRQGQKGKKDAFHAVKARNNWCMYTGASRAGSRGINGQLQHRPLLIKHSQKKVAQKKTKGKPF